MICAFLVMVILTIGAWRLIQNEAVPSLLFCGSWAIVFFLQSLFARDMYSSLFATLIILTISVFFVVGTGIGVSLFAESSSSRFKDKNSDRLICQKNAQKRLKRAVIIIGLLSLLGALQYMRALGLFEAGSLSEMLLMTGAIRVKTFSNEIQVHMVDKIGLLLAYSGVVLSASYWFFFGWRWWLLFSSVSVLIIGTAQAGRAGTLMILLQWGCVILLKRVSCKSYHIPRGLLLFPIGILVIFILGQLLREGFNDTSIESIKIVMHSSRSYLFGGVSAFAYYCDYMWTPTYISWGKYSFSSLFAALGLAKQEVGIYDFYVPISAKDEFSNVYTALRSFIDDFTLLGALIVFFIIGLAIGFYYKRFLKGDQIYVAILIPAFSFLLFSPMASLTYFNSFLLSLILPYAICRWSFQQRGYACKR